MTGFDVDDMAPDYLGPQFFKTLHVLAYVDAEPYRREIKGMRNLQEGRHDLARHLFHGRRGELHRAYHDGMEDPLGAHSAWSEGGTASWRPAAQAPGTPT